MKKKAAHIQNDLSAIGKDDSFLRSKYFSPLIIEK